MGIMKCVSCFQFALLAILSTAGYAGAVPCCPPGNHYEAGELLVIYEAGTSLARINEIADEIGASPQRELGDFKEPIWVMNVPDGSELEFIALFEVYVEVQSATINAGICVPGIPVCSCCPVGSICPDLPLSCQIFDDSLELPEFR